MEIKVKITMRYHDTLTSVGMKKRQIRISVDKDVEKSLSSYIPGRIREMGQLLWKTV